MGLADVPQTISLTARGAIQDQHSAEVFVLLATITHPALSAPVRLSSDPTIRISTDPLIYGTRRLGEVYPFVWMAAVLPDDRAEDVPRVSLAFANVGTDMAAPFRQVTSPARVDLTVVLSSTPDIAELEIPKLRAVRASYDGSQVVLEVSGEPFASLALPFHRMTADRFPGLHP